MKLKFILLLVTGMFSSFFCMAQNAPAVQWHFDGETTTSGTHLDWVYDVLPTSKKEYICCGYTDLNPVIFKLNKFGQLQWMYRFPALGTGYFAQLVETPNGFAAIGYVPQVAGGALQTLVVEVDGTGTVLNSNFYSIPGYGTAKGRCIAMDPLQQYYFIAGEADRKMLIEKIDYATNAVVATSIQGNMSVATAPSSPESGLVGGNTPFKIVTMPMGSSYHVFVTGMKSGTKDNQIYSVINQNSSTVNVRVKDKDIWLLSFDDNLSLVFDKSFDKAAISYPGSIVYPEAGPYSARTLSTSPVGTSTGASAYLNAAVNNDERGFDLELTQDGNLVVAALVNFIGVYNYLEGNGDKIVCNAGGFPDPHRSSWGTAYNYDEYTDGDAYLLKIDPNTGSLIWSKNVSHFSSKDFYPQVSQHCNGDYIVAGSSADYNTTDYLEPNSYDALTLETPDMPNTSSSPDHIWRKAFHAVGAATNFCLFGLRPTADGGFVVCGDNTPYGSVVKDKFTVTKLSPNPYDGINYDIPYSFAEGQTISGNTTWSPISWGKSDLYIARQIIIPAGVTLTIQNMNLHFAGADQLTDYWYFSTSMSTHQCGILVQPGGKLVVNNSILQGINTCHPFGITDQRQMWDGIVVEGDETQQQTASNQGTIVLNGSTIKDARVATSLSSASRFDVADPSVGVSTVASTNYSSRYYLTSTKMGV